MTRSNDRQPDAGAPDEIRLGSAGTALRRDSELVALADGGTAGARDVGNDEVIARFDGDAITVLRKSADSGSGRARQDVPPGPVYRTSAGGIAVPTGRVLVRFEADGNDAERARAIEKAGFRVVDVPAYAKNVMWVQAGSGRVEDALREMGALERLEGVAHVEPQVLMQAVRRG